jgi:hypothetical protein
LVTARQQLRKEGATRKRLATTIPGQSFLWGQVPGYKPQSHEVRSGIVIENGAAERSVFGVVGVLGLVSES